jgi:hypothetical protein
VVVDQRLQLHDVGDFFIKIPGPVENVKSLPDSTSEPGLRSGSVVWQGFAIEDEVLAARVELVPRVERERLPLSITIEAEVDGRAVDLSEPVSGRLTLHLTITNETGITLELPSARARSSEVGKALEAVRSALVRGERPEPGVAGVPRSVPVISPITTRSRVVVAPFAVRVRVHLGDATHIEAPGSRIRHRPSSVVITKNVVLTGRDVQEEIRINAETRASKPRLVFDARPSPPLPSDLNASGDPGGSEAVLQSAVGRTMLDPLVLVLAETASLPNVDGYLGNPDRAGPTRSSYRFKVVTPQEVDLASPPPAGEPPGRSGVGLAVAVLLTLLALVCLMAWWALS